MSGKEGVEGCEDGAGGRVEGGLVTTVRSEIRVYKGEEGGG